MGDMTSAEQALLVARTCWPEEQWAIRKTRTPFANEKSAVCCCIDNDGAGLVFTGSALDGRFKHTPAWAIKNWHDRGLHAAESIIIERFGGTVYGRALFEELYRGECGTGDSPYTCYEAVCDDFRESDLADAVQRAAHASPASRLAAMAKLCGERDSTEKLEGTSKE